MVHVDKGSRSEYRGCEDEIALCVPKAVCRMPLGMFEDDVMACRVGIKEHQKFATESL